MNINDLYWAAGFIEGEGCFYWHKKNAEITVTQKHKEPLEKLQKIFGIGKIYLRKGYKHYGPQFVWMITCRQAMGLMMTLYSLMSNRRKEKIKEIINIWKSRLGLGEANRRKTHCPKGHPYDKANTRYKISKKGSQHRVCKICEKICNQSEERINYNKEYTKNHKEYLKEYRRRYYEKFKK